MSTSERAATRDELAAKAASKFNWQGVVNRLRTHTMAFRIGFASGWNTREANFVTKLKVPYDKMMDAGKRGDWSANTRHRDSIMHVVCGLLDAADARPEGTQAP